METKQLKIAEQEAVLSETKSQIVSASAGSGKTTVMIKKILKILTEQECRVDELLVLTYTKSAASEMKKKLVEKLKEKAVEHEFLLEELDLVQSADISTFDSFCQKLVKKYFYVLDIDPSFGVLDGGEQAYLQGIALDKALAELKNFEPVTYENLLNNFSPARNEQNIKALVIEIFNYLTSVFNADEFWQQTFNMYDKKLRTAEVELCNYYNLNFSQLKQEFDELLLQAVENGFAGYAEYINSISSYIDSILLLKDLGEKVDFVNTISLKALYAQKNDEIGFKEKISEVKKAFAKLCDDIKKEYVDSKNIENSYENCEILIKNLKKLVDLFQIAYLEQKNISNSRDFNDIERLAIKLLQNPQINAEIKQNYKKIFVDEFQDANRVQEQIINLIDDGNLFFVGDTKQSIYAFRQSEPQIFLDIEKKFAMAENASAKTLNSNFRTNKNILDFVNKIFNVIMTPKTCGIDYQKNAQFVPKAEYEDLPNEVCVSLDIILNNEQSTEALPMTSVYSIKQNASNNSALSAYDCESAYICQKITELLGQDIFDKELGKTRRVNFGDITILLAKRGSFLKTLLKHLKNVGIPYVVNVNNNLEDCYDNMVLYNLLRLAMNSQDDYATYSVISSALFDFCDAELAEIKQYSLNEKYFYNCLKAYSNVENDLAQKVKGFFNVLNEFCFEVKYKGIFYALNKIVRQSNYLLKIEQDDGYAERKLNLLAYINSFSGSKFNFDLNSYILYRETAVRKEKVQADKSFTSAVEITTMHSSKGLEYPVVILPFLNQDYTKEPTHSEIKINKDLGIGIKNYDSDERSVFGGIFYNACKIKNKQIEISEKIRLLYVATTRAKNKLIMTGTMAKGFKKIKKDSDIFSINNYLALIVGALPENIVNQINEKTEQGCSLFNNNKLQLNVQGVSIKEPTQDAQQIFQQLNRLEEEKLVEFLNRDIKQSASNIALKNSVSEFAFDDDASQTFAPINFNISEHLSQKASDVGTLYHKLLQLCDFNQIKKVDDIKVFAECNFSKEDVSIFNQIGYDNIFNNIVKIQSLIPANALLLKEQKFVMRVKHCEVVDGGEDCYILVQGVIDLLIISDNKIILVDYKHSKKTDEEIKQTYERQLQLYSLALSKRFKGQNVQKIIVNLRKNSLIYM